MFNPVLLMAGMMHVMSVATTLIPVVEADYGPGTGPSKRQAVIDSLQKVGPALLTEMGLPDWAQQFILRAEVLGMVVDILARLQSKASDVLTTHLKANPATGSPAVILPVSPAQ